MSRKDHPATRKAAKQAARAVGTTARTAADHPRTTAAVGGVGFGSVLTVVLTGYVLVKIVRSRRVHHAAASSAERGAFGPGVATATKVAKRARREAEARS